MTKHLHEHILQVITPYNSVACMDSNLQHFENVLGIRDTLFEKRCTLLFSAALDGLSDLLWSQVLVSFDTTTSMDAEQQVVMIANSLRPVPCIIICEGFIRRNARSMKLSTGFSWLRREL